VTAVVGVLLVVFVVVSARLFVWPPTDRPTLADAAVALGGDPGQLRAAEAIALVRDAYAPLAVVSRGGVPEAPCPHPAGVRVVCFRPDPLNTRGEAEVVARLVASRHWTRIILVPERSQATRARLLFERCSGAQLIVVPVTEPASRLALDVVYEWAALAKALVLRRTC
jgi:uncharacterized SAM-binding protein YcdF (DUF218 family)